MTQAAWKEQSRVLLGPVIRLLARAGVTPLAVTLFGLALNIAAAFVIAYGHPVVGGLVLVAASLCDALDGELARRTGRVTRFGAFLDSTVDRVDETAVLAGIAAYFSSAAGGANPTLAVLACLALGGSLITSYARARAEGLGLECKVGFFERPERVVVTVLGLLAGRRALVAATLVLVVLSWFTVLQRVQHVRRVLGSKGDPGSAGDP